MRVLIVAVALMGQAVQADAFREYKPKMGKAASAAAVFHFKIDEERSCTGVFISADGEALTNLHCVEQCLTQAGVVQSEPLGSGLMNRNRVQLNQPVTCAGEFTQAGKPQQVTFQVEHVFGPGFLSPRESLPDLMQKEPDVYSAALNDGYEGRGDLVLLKVEGKTATCASVAAADLTQPVRVYGLSYPIVMRVIDRSNPFDPNVLSAFGTKMLYSEGEGTTDLRVPAAAGALTAQEESEIARMLAPGTFLSSVDAEGGASGSPLFNEKGQVVGILRATFNGDFTQYAAWRTQGIDIGAHLAEIQARVPSNSLCSGVASL